MANKVEEKTVEETKEVEVMVIENPIDMELTLKKMKEAQEYRDKIRELATKSK